MMLIAFLILGERHAQRVIARLDVARFVAADVVVVHPGAPRPSPAERASIDLTHGWFPYGPEADGFRWLDWYDFRTVPVSALASGLSDVAGSRLAANWAPRYHRTLSLGEDRVLVVVRVDSQRRRALVMGIIADEAGAEIRCSGRVAG